jgi:hypothetical protein
MDSEADLDAEIHSMRQLAAAPEHYTLLSPHAQSLVALLTHENTDIVISALELIQELVDEDALVDVDGDVSALNGMRQLSTSLVRIIFYFHQCHLFFLILLKIFVVFFSRLCPFF